MVRRQAKSYVCQRFVIRSPIHGSVMLSPRPTRARDRPVDRHRARTRRAEDGSGARVACPPSIARRALSFRASGAVGSSSGIQNPDPVTGIANHAGAPWRGSDPEGSRNPPPKAEAAWAASHGRWAGDSRAQSILSEPPAREVPVHRPVTRSSRSWPHRIGRFGNPDRPRCPACAQGARPRATIRRMPWGRSIDESTLGSRP